MFSGIITTILGKSATITKFAGRERRVHHSKSLPLPFIGERLFFSFDIHTSLLLINNIYQIVMFRIGRACAPVSRSGASVLTLGSALSA